MEKSTRTVLIVALAIGTLAVSYWGYTKHKEKLEMDKVNKNATPIDNALERLRKLRERNKN